MNGRTSVGSSEPSWDTLDEPDVRGQDMVEPVKKISQGFLMELFIKTYGRFRGDIIKIFYPSS